MLSRGEILHGDGVRTTTAHDTGGGNIAVTRYYTFAALSAGFGGAYETRDDGTVKKYYAFAGQTIAMRTCTTD